MLGFRREFNPQWLTWSALGILALWQLYPPVRAVTQQIIKQVSQPQRSVSHNNQPPQIKAFLDTIALAEVGTIGAEGYNKIVFRGTFNANQGQHPFVEGGKKANKNCAYIKTARKRVCSSASGRYQFLDVRYKELRQAGIIKDFTPPSQDIAAIYYLQKLGAYDLIIAGNVEHAFCKVGGFWASFPCNNYQQNPKTAKQLQAIYRQRLNYWQN